MKNLINNARMIYASIVMAIVIFLIFWLSYSSPWIAEDFIYQFNFAKGGEIVFTDTSSMGTPIQRIGDVFVSQWTHYLDINGRYVAHCIVQFIDSFLTPAVYGILNVIMYVVFIALLMRLCEIKYSDIRGLFSAIFLVLIAINTFYIPSYQVGYIWMGVLSLLFLNIYLYGAIHLTLLSSVLLAIFCVLAGNGQEAYTIGIGGALIIYNIRHFKQIKAWQWLMFFAFGLGILTVSLTPSTLHRASDMGVPIQFTLENFLCFLRVTYIFIIVLCYYKIKGSISLRRFFAENEFFIYFLLVSALFNIFIGVYCNRQLFGMELAAMILTLRLLHKHSFGKPVLILLGIYLLCCFSLKVYFVERENQLLSEIESKWLDSTDGRVYIDVLALPYNKYQAPFPIMTYGKPALGTIDQRLRYRYNLSKNLVVYPKALEGLTDERCSNQVIEYQPYCYFLVQDKANPAKFVIEREYYLLGLSYPMPDYEVVFDPNGMYNTLYCNITKFDNQAPFVRNKGVKIIGD